MKFFLKQCVWEITLACCFSCKYCGSKGGTHRNNELTTEECLDIVRQLADIGCQRVILIGGEIFMRKDWFDICCSLTSSGISTAIITNGFLFTNEIIEKIKSANLECVGVSLDSIEFIHDKYRQAGSYSRAKRAVEILSKNGIDVALISTLNHENSQYLNNFYSEIKHWPIYGWQLQACSPMGNAHSNGIDYEFDHKSVIQFITSILDDAPFSIGLADSIGYFTEKEGYLRGNSSGEATFRGCSAGISSIGIDSVGNVRGCESMYDDFFIEGNLRDQKLEDIWNSPETFLYNRRFKSTLLTGKCKDCEFGNKCGGGCRSYNYFTHNQLYEAKYCAKNL